MRCDAYLANALRIFRDSRDIPDECAGRAIIHASYYAVFHLVALRLALDVVGADPAKHSDLRRRLIAYVGADAALMEARRHFASLQRARVDADYRLHDMVTLDQVRIALRRAQAIFAAAGIAPQTS